MVRVEVVEVKAYLVMRRANCHEQRNVNYVARDVSLVKLYTLMVWTSGW